MARITSREAIDHFIGFVVSASITTLLTVFAIWRRKPWITRLRLLTVFPLGVSASIPAYLHINLKGFFTRAWRDSDARARARSAYDALAIAGILLTVWVFITTLLLGYMKQRRAGEYIDNKALNRKRSSGYFYVFLCDLVPMSMIVMGLVRAGQNIPWAFGWCAGERYLKSDFVTVIRLASGDNENEGACKRAAAIQLASTFSLALMLLQHIVMYPVITFPASIRLIIFISVRQITRPARPKASDLELGDLPLFPTNTEKTPRQDITRELLSKIEKTPSLHYTDMLHTARSTDGFGSLDHLDLLAEKCCAQDKTECWACGNVVCEGCKSKLAVPVPRTTQHLANCYVLCTKCYLIKAPSQPVQLSAAAQRKKLSLKTPNVTDVEICKDCAAREPEQIRGIRETREQAFLAKALRRSIPCAMCEKPLGQGKWLWWMCGAAGSGAKHDHYECHWVGHEGIRSKE